MTVDVISPREWSRPALGKGGDGSYRLLLIAGVALSLVFAFLLLYFSGPGKNFFAPFIVFAGLLAVPVLLRRPVLGLYVLMGAAVAVETDPLAFGARVTDHLPFFHDINNVTGVRGLYLNPAEIVIMLTAAGWLLRADRRGRPWQRRVPLLLPLSAFAGLVAFGFVYGLLTGGDAKIALWMIRPFAYFYLTYALTLQLIDSRRQIDVLIWLVLLAGAFKGAIGWWRYHVDLGGDLNALNEIEGMNSLMAHEESFFFLAVIMLAAVSLFYGGPRRRKTASLLAVPVVLLPFLANQRRAGSLALILAIAILCLVTFAILTTRRRSLLALATLGIVLVPLYAATSWGGSSLAGEPVRAVRSGVDPSQRDLASNEYREVENLNVEHTVRTSPLFGIGFGKEMVMKWPLPDLSDSFAWYRVAPHNTVLWVMMTTGILGFALFWQVMGGLMVRLLMVARRLRRREDKGVAVYGLLMLVGLLVFALLDHGLLAMRVMTFGGILLGCVFALPYLERRDAKRTRPRRRKVRHYV